MPKITNEKIEDGFVIGYASTQKVGSECTFEICSVEEWEELSEEEAEKLAQEAMYESGVMDWGY